MASKEYLLIREAESLIKINIPAKIPNKGAVIKKRSGAQMGGAWSIESPLKSKKTLYSTIRESIISTILSESLFRCCCAIV